MNGKVIDLRRAREERELDRTMDRDPDLILEAWLDDQGQIVGSCLKGTARAPSDSSDQKDDLAMTCLGLARQGVVILSEMPGGECVEPVLLAMVTRNGYYMTQPNRFWHDEAEATSLKDRASAALWVLRQCWGLAKPILANCLTLVFRPSTLRNLESE